MLVAEKASDQAGRCRSPKIAVSSAGRFHMFDLARQMERLGLLQAVYTGYPRQKVDGLPSGKVRTHSLPTLARVALGRFGFRANHALSRWITESHDRWTASTLTPCDVFHCLSGFGLESHRIAKEQYGALTVCDRGSSHIAFQERIMREEYARWGMTIDGIDPRIVERELAEYELCDLIFVPSTFTWRSFVEQRVPEAKLRKNPYGVDLGMFKPVPKRDDVFRVIYAGALSLRKGIPHLLEALAPLRLPRFEVWLIGSALPEARTFLARHEGRFRAWGVLPRVELYKYYSQGSVFVIASIEEGLALVQAQAMACGLPVIATENTGAADLFSDGVEGFIVPIRDPAAIREKVVYLYEHPDVREQMAAAAIQRVRSLGGWNAYGERAAAYYRDALQGGVEAN